MKEPKPDDAISREETIFNAAVQLRDPAKRALYLEMACESDLGLRERIEKLIAAEPAGDTFFAQRPATPPLFSSSPPASACDALGSEAKPGDRICRYKLLEKIGEGGCGVVYMAEQEEPVKRRVALKVIKLGMDTKSVIARFEAERQALAMMDHPNIAKVLDGGATETGRPYFVMELVRGIKITEYCDQNNLSTRERLALFVQVCQAVQHAHQKGIIHRDLKPSNILVTINDGVPVPKIIDFGIAKATAGQELTDKTIFTAFEQFIGTPAYMSPEQALMTSLDIDTRSDVYSLGVLLYELLTGRTPLDTPELLKVGLDEMRRTIREKEPARPSNRLSTLPKDDLTTAAKRRATNPPQLIHDVSGDLDWIVMKCLEKDRTRRYETANGLAADVQRHLKNEPIVARPPSRIYQFQKMVQRNRVAFAAGVAVLLALLSGLSFSTWTLFRERAARQKAAIETAKARQVASFLKDMIRGIEPSVAMGRDVTLLREIVDQTMARIGKEQNLPDEVEVELRATLGGVYHQLDSKKAEAMYRETLPKMKRLLGNDHAEVAALLRDFACVLRDRGKYEESEAVAREALAISRRVHGPEHLEVAASLQQMASSLDMRKRFTEAEKLHRESLDMHRKFHGPEHRDIASGLRWLANSFDEQGRIDEAEAMYREALAMMKKVQGDVHPDVAIVLSHFTDLLHRLGKFDEEEQLLREQLFLYRKLLGNERQRVANTLNALGALIHNRGRYAEAEPHLREALVIRKKLLGEEHKEVALSMYNLGMTLREQERLSEAEEMFRSAEAIQKKLIAADDDELLLTVRNLALVLLEQRKYAEAESPLRECAMQARRKGAPPEKVENRLADLAEAIYRQNKFAEAESLYREVLESRDKRLAADHEGVITAKASIGRLLAEWAWVERTVALRSALPSASSANQERTAISPLVRAREGERLLQECLTARLHGTNASHWRTSDIRSRLGGALLSVAVTDADLSAAARSNKLAEAEALLIDAHGALQQSRAGWKYKHDAIERLVRLYEVWSKPTQTATWRAKLNNLEQTKAEKVADPVQEARQ